MQTLINMIFGAFLAALTLGPAAWADLLPNLAISATAATTPIQRSPTVTPDGP